MAYYNPYVVYPNAGNYQASQQQMQMTQQPYQQTQPAMMAQQPMQQNNNSLTVRYVTGREEAVASQVLPDGNLCVFVDIAHGMIYTKQVNPQTLVCSFYEYQRVIPMEQQIQQQSLQQQNAQQYVTVDQFDALRKDVDDIMSSLTASTKQPQTTKTTNTDRR